MSSSKVTLPVIDISPLCGKGARSAFAASWEDNDERAVEVARDIGAACKDYGFFYIKGWEKVVDPSVGQRLESLAREFFARPLAEKMKIDMKQSGLHWKGYFASGAELTSGRPDSKEGIYFGEEYARDSVPVQRGLAMHGPNQFPEPATEWRAAVLAYLEQMTVLGLCIMRGVALSLGLPGSYFEKKFCTPKPFTPLRVFHYPVNDHRQSVGRHTDYGVLTILKQDSVGGLQVEVQNGEKAWIDAPPIDGTFVVNIGDMLELWTGGLYAATPHRVKSRLDKSRISIPFFFDPAFEAIIDPEDMRSGSAVLRNAKGDIDEEIRRSETKPILYGEYITHRISSVFPKLFKHSGGTDTLVSKM